MIPVYLICLRVNSWVARCCLATSRKVVEGHIPVEFFLKRPHPLIGSSYLRLPGNSWSYREMKKIALGVARDFMIKLKVLIRVSGDSYRYPYHFWVTLGISKNSKVKISSSMIRPYFFSSFFLLGADRSGSPEGR